MVTTIQDITAPLIKNPDAGNDAFLQACGFMVYMFAVKFINPESGLADL